MQNMVPMRDAARLVASQCSLRLDAMATCATGMVTQGTEREHSGVRSESGRRRVEESKRQRSAIR